jgi:hypothetical protein
VAVLQTPSLIIRGQCPTQILEKEFFEKAKIWQALLEALFKIYRWGLV